LRRKLGIGAVNTRCAWFATATITRHRSHCSLSIT
jgi:hypothetical protein